MYGGYGEQQDDGEEDLVVGADGQDTNWFVQGGIERKFFPLGKSTIFAEYRHDERGTLSTVSGLGTTISGNDVVNADLDFWAAGIVQGVDAAAIDLYVIYRHAEGDVRQFSTAATAVDDFDMVITGARIKF